MFIRDLLNNSAQKDLLAALSRAAGTYNGSSVDTKGKGRKVLLLLSAGSFGVGATLDAKLQESDDGTTWTDVPGGTFTQKTTAGAWVLQVTLTKRYIRGVKVVGTAAVVSNLWGVIFGLREVPSGI